MTRRLAVLIAILALYSSACSAMLANEPAQSVWRPLFDGRTLEGWTVKITGYDAGENVGRTFRVEDGLIKVRYDEYGEFDGRFGHLFYKEPFSHYRLRVEYRFVGEQAPGGPGWALRNSGVMLHGERPDQMERDQEFPTSIEVQFLGGNGSADRTTANLCTPGTNVVIDGELVTRHCTNAASPTFHLDRWVTVEVEVCGSRSVRHLVDGQVVLAYGEPQLDPRDAHAKAAAEAAGGTLLLERGTISLQSESHPVDFRRVDVLELDPATCGQPTPP